MIIVVAPTGLTVQKTFIYWELVLSLLLDIQSSEFTFDEYNCFRCFHRHKKHLSKKKDHFQLVLGLIEIFQRINNWIYEWQQIEVKWKLPKQPFEGKTYSSISVNSKVNSGNDRISKIRVWLNYKLFYIVCKCDITVVFEIVFGV